MKELEEKRSRLVFSWYCNEWLERLSNGIETIKILKAEIDALKGSGSKVVSTIDLVVNLLEDVKVYVNHCLDESDDSDELFNCDEEL